MKDLPALFNASVVPLCTLMACFGLIFMACTGQELDMFVLSIFGGGLSKMGISFGIGKIKKK